MTAEAIGTNTPIATAPVQNGKFNLALPAAGGPTGIYGFGTLYDLALAGGGDTYGAERLLPLYPGQPLSQDFTPKGSQTLGNITGTITDNCVATKPIVGATLQLLIPPNSVTVTPRQHRQPSVLSTPNNASLSRRRIPTTPATSRCRVHHDPAAVPKRSGCYRKKRAYAMEISAPGYDSLFVQAIPSAGKKRWHLHHQPAGTTFTTCDLALNTGYISGTIPIIPPNPGQTTLVQVFAEDHGTNNIESALPMPISRHELEVGTCPGPPSYSCVSFTLNVPTSDTVPQGFDLFATTIDLYQGVTDPYQGHTIAVLADVAAPAPPSAPGICNTTTTANFPLDQTIDCVGHGSVTAVQVVSPTPTSAPRWLSNKTRCRGDNVQITNALVQNQSPNCSPSNSYAFCVPADIYQLQRVQMPLPVSLWRRRRRLHPAWHPHDYRHDSAASAIHTPKPTPSANATGGPTPTATMTPSPGGDSDAAI